MPSDDDLLQEAMKFLGLRECDFILVDWKGIKRFRSEQEFLVRYTIDRAKEWLANAEKVQVAHG